MDTLSPGNRTPKTHDARRSMNRLASIGEGMAAHGVRWEGEDKSWTDGLPDDLKSNPTMTRYKTSEDAHRGHIELQSKIGANRIAIPGKDAKPEEWTTVFKSLGLPETSDKYALTDIKLPEGLSIQEEGKKVFLTEAHKLGLLPTQVDGLWKWYAGVQSNEFNTLLKDAADGKKNAEADLRKVWGKGYDERIARIKKMVNKFADKEAVATLDSGFGADPTVLKFLHNVADKLSEDVFVDGTPTITATPQETQTEITKIRADLKHPYHIKNHPEHKAAVQRVADLYALIEDAKKVNPI